MVGYRHYDTNDVVPRFCFGHGLSYSTFDYRALTLTRDESDVGVKVDVTNTGSRRGADVVQVYVRRPGSQIERPEKELKAFERIGWILGRAFGYNCTLANAPFDTGTLPKASGRSSLARSRSLSAPLPRGRFTCGAQRRFSYFPLKK